MVLNYRTQQKLRKIFFIAKKVILGVLMLALFYITACLWLCM